MREAAGRFCDGDGCSHALGPIGKGAHAAHEHIVAEHLLPRTALLAGLIAGM